MDYFIFKFLREQIKGKGWQSLRRVVNMYNQKIIKNNIILNFNCSISKRDITQR